MTEPSHADEAEAVRQHDAAKIDEILQRINVGPQTPGAMEPRLERATGLIWSIVAALVVVGAAALVFHFIAR